MKKLYKFLMTTNPEKSMQGVVLKFPDAKFFLILSAASLGWVKIASDGISAFVESD